MPDLERELANPDFAKLVVGALTLRTNYLSTTNDFLSLQSYGNLLQEQAPLELPGDAGLSYEVRTFQGEMKAQARYFNNKIVTEYIRLFTMGTNFYALWKAMFDNDIEHLQHAFENEIARKASFHVFKELSDQAGKTNQVASAFVEDLKVLNVTLAKLDSKLDSALDASIKQLEESAIAESAKIDKLKKAIEQNINDIVAGASKVGAATSELIIGVLTTITDAKVDVGSKGGKGGETQKDGNGGKDKGDSGVPSTDFAVSAIQGATEGAAETAQARADLNANNEKLSVAYQNLARANALVAVAKVVKVQNEMFISVMKEAQEDSMQLAATWGQAPITPPGSGITLEFANFAQQIESVSSQKDADSLVDLCKNASMEWDLLNEKLSDLKRAMVDNTAGG
jgi:hypothetical protein